jgi:hypothetical protein
MFTHATAPLRAAVTHPTTAVTARTRLRHSLPAQRSRADITTDLAKPGMKIGQARIQDRTEATIRASDLRKSLTGCAILST